MVINIENCRIVNFKNFNDNRGNLVAIEYPKDINFDIKRIYYIYDVSKGVERGFHSHKRLEQILIAVHSSVKVRVSTPYKEEIFELNDPSKGLYIGPMIWREMFDFSEGAVLLVLASENYNEKDYIRDKNEYAELGKIYWKNDSLNSKNLMLDFVKEDDAEFLLSLRTDEELSKHLSKIDNSIEMQREWIREYKKREKDGKEFYFKAISLDGEDLGFARLYNIDSDKKEITFGSFIMKKDRPKYAAIETMILLMNYAFNNLNMNKILLDVRIKNERAKNFYKRFGFDKLYENDNDEFYELIKEKYTQLYKEKYEELISKEGASWKLSLER